MVPALVVHCVNEVESRGLNEVGLYRISGSEKDVKALKVKTLSKIISHHPSPYKIYQFQF